MTSKTNKTNKTKKTNIAEIRIAGPYTKEKETKMKEMLSSFPTDKNTFAIGNTEKRKCYKFQVF